MSTQCYDTPMVLGREPDNWSQFAKEDTNAQTTEKSDDTTRHSSRPLWTPFFLRRPVIVAFLIAFFAILCSLVALFVYSVRQHSSLGIKTAAGSKYYYLWTYGPTAGMSSSDDSIVYAVSLTDVPQCSRSWLRVGRR